MLSEVFWGPCPPLQFRLVAVVLQRPLVSLGLNKWGFVCGWAAFLHAFIPPWFLGFNHFE